MSTTEFKAALGTFLTGCQGICDNDVEARENGTTLEVVPGAKRYLKINRTTTGYFTSIHCYVDMKNGDVLRPDGYRSPGHNGGATRCVRGNIFADDNGLTLMLPLGTVAHLQVA